MFCENCGAQNSGSAKFCRKCGREMPEEETRVAIREAAVDAPPDEREIFVIGPTLVFVKMGYAAAAVGAVLFVAVMSIFLPAIVPVWAAVILALLLFLVPASYHLKQKLVRYRLTDSTLEFDEGLLSRTTRNVPLRRIQDVTVSATPWQRLLGFGDVVIDNASEEGGKAVLKNINSPKQHAEILLKEMRRIGN